MGRKVKPPRLEKPYDNGFWYIIDRRKQISTKTADDELASQKLADHIHSKVKTKRENEGCTSTATVQNILDFYVKEHVNTPEVIDRERIMYAIAAMGKAYIDTGFSTKFFTALLLGELTRDIFRQYGRVRGVGAGTIRYEFTILRSAFNHSLKEGRLKPGDVPIIEMPDAPKKKKRWLRMEEARALVAACTGRIRLFIYIALATCGRKDAIENLKWSQVDFRNRRIDLAPDDHEETAKRRALTRFGDYMWELLQHEYGIRTSEFVLGSNADVRWGFNTACERAGMPDVTPHVLRHTAAMWMAEDGIPAIEIAAALGDTIETVVREYMHFSPTHLLAPAEAMNKRMIEFSEQHAI